MARLTGTDATLFYELELIHSGLAHKRKYDGLNDEENLKFIKVEADLIAVMNRIIGTVIHDQAERLKRTARKSPSYEALGRQLARNTAIYYEKDLSKKIRAIDSMIDTEHCYGRLTRINNVYYDDRGTPTKKRPARS